MLQLSLSVGQRIDNRNGCRRKCGVKAPRHIILSSRDAGVAPPTDKVNMGICKVPSIYISTPNELVIPMKDYPTNVMNLAVNC